MWPSEERIGRGPAIGVGVSWMVRFALAAFLRGTTEPIEALKLMIGVGMLLIHRQCKC